MENVVYIFITALLVIVISLVVVWVKRKSFGSISGKAVYQDTKTFTGAVLYSDMLQLKGKPDYIMQIGQDYIPVEVKTGKTPSTPYPNHVAQLYAYCALIEDNYDSPPKYGVIKYPEKEFQIEYTVQNRDAVGKLIQEMVQMKISGSIPQCNHPNHNIE
jgi:CRISPR-associated exonuclease Cas4